MKRFLSCLTMLFIMSVFFGCSGGSSDSPAATTTTAASVQGRATNPATGVALSGATVNAYTQTSTPASATGMTTAAAAVPVATATTGADGSFTITGLISGVTYYFEYVSTGNVTFVYYNVIPSTTVLLLETISPIPTTWLTQTATTSGKVKNASTDAGLPNMTVKIWPGVNYHTGTPTATTTTDAAGAYSFANLHAGTYTAEVTGNIGSTAIITTYATLVCFPGVPLANANQDITVTTPVTGSGYRIVLSWDNNPSDLDSHLTGPTATAGTRFHTWYVDHDFPIGSAAVVADNYVAGASTEAVLDVDNTEHGIDNGPETTTILVPRNGTYRFYVHHFAGSATISTSGAQVKVYKGNALLASFNPPFSAIGDNAVWSVFTMDVTANGQTITAVNSIAQGDNDLLAPASVGNNSFDEFYLFKNLPRK